MHDMILPRAYDMAQVEQVFFEHVGARSGISCGLAQARVVVIRDHHNTRLRESPLDASRRGDAVKTGHAYVHQDPIRLALCVCAERLRAVATFRDVFKHVSDNAANQAAHRLVVFNNQKSRHQVPGFRSKHWSAL